MEEKKIFLRVTDKAKKKLAVMGYDPAFGARPLKRVIQRSIQDPLALKMLEGDYKEGDAVEVNVDAKDNFSFRSVKA